MGFGNMTTGTWFAPFRPKGETLPLNAKRGQYGKPVNLLNQGISAGTNWNARDVLDQQGLGIFSKSSERILADTNPFSIDAMNLKKRQTENMTSQPPLFKNNKFTGSFGAFFA